MKIFPPTKKKIIFFSFDMSLSLHDGPDSTTSFQLKWKIDWDSFMIREFVETLFGAVRDDKQALWTIPAEHKLYFITHLEEINQKLSRETLQFLGRAPKVVEQKMNSCDATVEDVRQVQKSNPCFYQFRSSPFCWCFYQGRQSIACDFCRFACCANAVREDIVDPLAICSVHGSKRLEKDFSE